MSEEELKKQNEELAAKVAELQKAQGGDEIGVLQNSVSKLQEDLSSQKVENLQMKLDLAKKEALQTFPLAAGFEADLTGGTKEEITEKAKRFHENVLKSNATAMAGKEAEIQGRWGQLPHGSPPGVIKQEDLDADYAKAKESGNIMRMIGHKFKFESGLAKKKA